MLVLVPIAGAMLATFGPSGYRGDLRRIYPSMTYALFGVTLLCVAAVWNERRRLAGIESEEQRGRLERRAVARVGWVYVCLAASIPVGYLIGQRF